MIPNTIVLETASVGDLVLEVVATGGAGSIEYSIVNGNSRGDFTINQNTGRVTVDNILNFETVSSYTLRVRAVSTGTTVEGEMNYVISVGDVNESPFFTTPCAPTTCSYSIDENGPAVSAIGQIMADDPDLMTVPNGMLTYRIPGGIPFSVDPSGNIRTTASLDRENRGSYMFSLTVMDGCPGCALSIQTSVVITVNDLNDNSPVFAITPPTATVREDAQPNTVVAEYRVTDDDIGQNAAVSCTLTPNGTPFTLSTCRTLHLTGDIDFETTQTYDVMITATNPDGLSTTSNTQIQIININDNTPVIMGEPYMETVVENTATNTEVVTIIATDADLGVHGQLEYNIISGNLENHFALDSGTGILTINSNIDREISTSFSLVVEARDRGTPQTRSDSTTIEITIEDVNDNPPIFNPDIYNMQLREDQPTGENVIRVIATDADQLNTPNSNIIYSITSGNSENRFVILSSGQIRVSQALDFETTPSYTLVVEARDEGWPVMTGTASVIINIVNVNENPPTLSGDQSVDVSERTPTTTTIAVFQAEDQDQMSISISIASGNSEGKFTIGQSSGIITLAASLDYERTTSYTLIISASDGQLSTSASLIVNVIDENEFAPVFAAPFDFTVTEEEPAGSEVGTVMATDGDRDAIVVYAFVVQDLTTENFDLDSNTGVITTSSVLDRENLEQTFNRPDSEVVVRISAMDNGSPSMFTIREFTITLMDINDNSPIFSASSYSNQLLENLPIGEDVFTTTATDRDLGSNAVISYSFTLTNNQGSSNPFEIDSDTGAIVTTESLDRELQPSYLFTILATDGGNPPMSSTVSGELTVLDVNDNTPMFNQSIYRVSVTEFFTPGDTVSTFFATDADVGQNGDVSYSILFNTNEQFIEGVNEETSFEIGTESGILRTLNSFDFETASQVNVTIFATDNGLPQLTGTTTLVMDVINIDEFPPIFSFSPCDRIVSEDTAVGTIISSCTATDFDTIATGDQLPITYSFTSNPLTNEFFQINAENGDIAIKAALDREENSAFRVEVVATDLAGKTSRRNVLFRITDANDNSPQFQETPYNFFFTDSVIRSNTEEFLTLPVSDPDRGSNGTFTLEVGRISLVTSTETLVEVIAKDNGTPQMSNSINVTVTFQSPCQLQKYSITGDTLYAQLLCSVEVSPSPSFPLVLGSIGSLTCLIVRNSPTRYQWLHNGTTLTTPEFVEDSATGVGLSLSNIRVNSAGEYACRATSEAGSLQSQASSATIQGKIQLSFCVYYYVQRSEFFENYD